MKFEKARTVTVVHLIWVPLGINQFKKFIDSYAAFQGNYPHNLILIFNGVEDELETRVYHDYIGRWNIGYKSYYRLSGKDIETYFYILNYVDAEFILFLNSYSEIQCHNWLLYYMEAGKDSSVGLVGATGSFHSIFSSINWFNSRRYEYKRGLKFNFDKFKLLIKNNCLYRFYFPKFPNPHIRTNGFMIRKNIMEELIVFDFKTKLDTYKFESGFNSLTRQILKKGLDVVIIDKLGRRYKMDKWYESKTFWAGCQENLLIKDNQTIKFEGSSEFEKGVFIKMAWGI